MTEAEMNDRKCATEGCDSKRHGLDMSGYCKGCKGGKKPERKKPASRAKAPAETPVIYLVPLDVSEAHLDRFWLKLSIEEKGQALQAVLDANQQ